MDRAWVYYYRITYAEKLEAAAVCALLGDHDALDFLTRYFDFYADNYALFPVEKLQTWKEKLFRPMAEVIANPNITAPSTIMCSIIMMRWRC